MDELIPLLNANLDQIKYEKPRYDRSQLTAGIVHIGVGNFHRAHQAWYLHRLMQQGLAHDWAIIGAGVRAYDGAMREKLKSQDCLTTLLSLDPKEQSIEIIGPMIDYIEIEAGNAPLIEAMSRPEIRIVSLTITEGGYYIDPVTGHFDLHHADIVHDIQNPDQPSTAFGAIIAALKIRREEGRGPLSLQSCDNIQGNGNVLKATILGLARAIDSQLSDWINENVSFPNSMVDCIAPSIGADEIDRISDFGIKDVAPVMHEPFRFWVSEDNFCASRPPWEKSGMILTQDVHTYEAMKLRLLNGGHQLLANAGELLGLETIADCMSHTQVSAFFKKVAQNEIAPYVRAVPQVTPSDYIEQISVRFMNPQIKDSTRRVAFDGSSRHPGFLLPSIKEGIEAGTSIEGLALSQALWARMCAGVREDQSAIEANDPNWKYLNEVANRAILDPIQWLEGNDCYAQIAHHQDFRESFVRWMHSLRDKGTLITLNEYLA